MSAVLIFMFFVGFLVVSLGVCTYAVKKGMKPAKAVIMQLCSFAILFVASFASTALVASAEGEPSSAEVSTSSSTTAAENQAKSDKEWDSIAMALVMGLASIGSGIAVAAAAPAAIGATSEDPKAFGKAIVFVGLAEGVSIFGLLIAIFIKFI